MAVHVLGFYRQAFVALLYFVPYLPLPDIVSIVHNLKVPSQVGGILHLKPADEAHVLDFSPFKDDFSVLLEAEDQVYDRQGDRDG